MSKERKMLNKIKGLVGLDKEIELEEITLPDGKIIFAEEYVVGESVFIQTEEGERVPLPVGEYELPSGQTLVVSEEGIIGEIREGAPEEEAPEEMSEEVVAAIEKTIKDLNSENKDLKGEVATLKKEKSDLSKVNLSKPRGIRRNPEGIKSRDERIQIDPRTLTTRQRINLAMQNTPFYKDNVKLTTDTTVTTTYAGEFAGEYIAAATLQGVTLGTNAITIKENIKDKEVVKRIATADILADASCAFTPVGTVDIDERILDPKELQVNMDLCKLDFKADWEAIGMGYSAFDVLPPNFNAFFVENMAALVNEAIETNIYQGLGSNAGEFDGFAVQLKADTDVVDVDNTGVTIDETTVIAELGRVADAIPQTLWNTDDLKIFCSPNIARAYTRALGGFGTAGLGGSGYMGQGPAGEKPLNFDGIPLFVANGLGASEMIAGQKRNLWYGTGLLSDNNQVKVLDMADLDGSENVRFVMRFTAGTQYGVGSEVVYYWTVV